mgnify:FL=1
MTVVVPASVMPVPVAVMPAHLLRLQAVDLVTRGDGRMRIAARRRACILVQEKRRERRRLGGHCERGGAGGDTEGDLQKIPAFHEHFPLLLSWINRARQVFSPRPEHSLNRVFTFRGTRCNGSHSRRVMSHNHHGVTRSKGGSASAQPALRTLLLGTMPIPMMSEAKQRG